MPLSLYGSPAHIDKCSGLKGYGNCHDYVKKVAGHKQRIPNELSLDRVIDGKTLSVSYD